MMGNTTIYMQTYIMIDPRTIGGGVKCVLSEQTLKINLLLYIYMDGVCEKGHKS